MSELANHKPLAHLDEEALLCAIRTRKPEALVELYDRFSEIVYSVSLRILREPSAAEGVLQEVFIHLWRSPDSYLLAPSSLGARLILSSRNHAINELRGLHLKDHSEDILLACEVNLADPAVRESLTRKVRQAMTEMTSEQRRALELAFFEGKTPAEIAQSTGGESCAIKDHLRSALLLLRHATG